MVGGKFGVLEAEEATTPVLLNISKTSSVSASCLDLLGSLLLAD